MQNRGFWCKNEELDQIWCKTSGVLVGFGAKSVRFVSVLLQERGVWVGFGAKSSGFGAETRDLSHFCCQNVGLGVIFAAKTGIWVIFAAKMWGLGSFLLPKCMVLGLCLTPCLPITRIASLSP